MERDINGFAWYVHSEGIHEGGFCELDQAISFATQLLLDGKQNVVIETRKWWIDSIDNLT